MELDGIKALAFDVFGTVVDWRGSILAELEAFGARRGIVADWARFVDEWRGAYKPMMDRVRRGDLPWTNIDGLHAMALERLLDAFGIRGELSPGEVEWLNKAWHRLAPWPDVPAGLGRLKQRFILATLSNGNMALLVNMAKHSGLPWDCILSAELCRHYKTDPEVYRMACTFLDVAPHELMLVAAHDDDLAAARMEGLRTGFVVRPMEYGPHQRRDRAAEHDFDLVARDFGHLADLLGCP